MRLVIVGASYVEPVSRACFADLGHDARRLDIDPRRIASLHCGELRVYETGPADLVLENSCEGRLNFKDAAEGATSC